MKDARGHGSDAHASGVQQIGRVSFDHRTVSSGRPVSPDDEVMHADPRAMIAALQATDPEFATFEKLDRVRDYVANGGRLSMPEVHAYQGSLRFINGRNRTKLAADAGLSSIPIAVDRTNVGEMRALLSKYGRAR